MTGGADICSFQPVTKTGLEYQPFLLSEEGERPLCILKSRQDEYVWTDRALIHVDGQSATSTKRLITRYAYAHHRLSDVLFETAGVADRDCEIKFRMGSRSFSLDVAKGETARLAGLYKALTSFATVQAANAAAFEDGLKAVALGTEATGRTAVPTADAAVIGGILAELTNRTLTMITTSRAALLHTSPDTIFARYSATIYPA